MSTVEGATPEAQPQGATPETAAPTAPGATPEATNPPTEQPAGDDLAALRAQLESANARIKELNKENEAKRKAATAAEQAALAEQGRFKELFEKSQTELDQLKAQLAQSERARTIQEIAAKHNLPPELAARLQGETPEELEADAKQLQRFAQPKREAPPSEAGRTGALKPGEITPERRAELAQRFRLPN